MFVQNHVIIVAGGKGLRMGSDIPKQFIPVGGKPVLMHTIDAFYKYDAGINVILVLPVTQQVYWKQLCAEYNFARDYKLVDGGETRFHSVKNGLDLITGQQGDLIAVHDGVRPFVSMRVIEACYNTAACEEAVVPVVDIVETVRRLSASGSCTVNRDDYKLVQTPQVFTLPLLKRAYEQEYTASFTDDASVVEAMGVKVALVSGNRENIKITTPFDLKIANALL